MKTLKQYEKELAVENLSFDKEIITEGWLRNLIKDGISLYAKIFKFADNKHKEFLKKKALDKELQKLESCKTRTWWDNYFKGTDWEKKWYEINPINKKDEKKEDKKEDKNNDSNKDDKNKEQAKESLINNSRMLYEAEMVDGNGSGIVSKSNTNNPTTLEEMFTEEKFIQYTENGMTELIITGFCLMYDLGKTHNDKQVMTIAVKFMKSALKMNDKAVSQENKKDLEKAIKQQEEAAKDQKDDENTKEETKVTPEEKKEIEKSVNTITSTVGVKSNGDKIQKAIQPLIPLETSESFEYKLENQILEAMTKTKDMPSELQQFKKNFLYKSGALSKNADALKTNRDCIILFASAVDGILTKMVDSKGKSASTNKELILKALSQMLDLQEFKKYLGK